MAWQKRIARRRSTLGARRNRRGAWFEAFEERVLLATFSVINSSDGGAGSLRQAVLDANGSTGLAEIQFAPSLGTITLGSPLTITHPVVVNSTSQTGVVIDGGGTTANGFVLGGVSGGSTIQGLTIQHFAGAAVSVQSSNNAILANAIGPNGTAGVSVQSGAQNVVSQNLYVGANGTGSPASVSDINVSLAANNGVLPPTIASATTIDGSLRIQFSTALPAGTTVEVYQSTTTTTPATRTYLGLASVSAAGDSATLPSSPALGSTILATATLAADGTSAFSNESTIVDPYTVTTASGSSNVAGSLPWVVGNVDLAAAGDPVIAVKFASSLGTIALASPLTITHPAVVNSTSQPGIVIDGGGAAIDGFVLGGSGGSTIQGLTIQNFGGAGINVQSSNNKIVGNTIGASGAPNGTGVLISAGSSNTVGSADAGGPNTIGPNGTAGVSVQSGTQNVVSQNLYVGANGSGSPASVSDINVNPSANNGQLPPHIQSAVSNPSGLKIQFSAPLPGGTVVQIYQSVTTGQAQRSILGFATIPAAGADFVTLTPVPAAGTTILVTAAPVANGTSAFSNEVPVFDVYTVTTSSGLDTDQGSLPWVIKNVNLAAAGDPPIAVKFAPSLGTITLAAPLTITHPVVLNSNHQTGVVIDGGGTTANGFILGGVSGGSTIQGLTIQHFAGAAVSVQSSNNAILANAIGPNGTAGVSVQSGAQNVVSRNLYVGANGTGSPASVSDINVSLTANNGVLPPTIASATNIEGNLKIQFSAPLAPGTVVEVYQSTTTTTPAARTFLGSATIPLAGGDTVVLPSSPALGSTVLATASPIADGTSAFSNESTIVDPYTVTTNSGSPKDAGSLSWVFNNVNARHSTSTVPIVFNLSPGTNVIDVSANPLPTLFHSVVVSPAANLGVVIDGNNTALDGIVLGAGSGGSTIQGLTIQNFSVGVLVLSSDNLIGGNGTQLANTFKSNSTAAIEVFGAAAIQNHLQQNLVIQGTGSSTGILLLNGGNKDQTAAVLESANVGADPITHAPTVTVTGSFNPTSGGDKPFTLDVFAQYGTVNTPSASYSPAYYYLGSFSLPASGGFTTSAFKLPNNGLTFYGVTTTVTSSDGNTSAFSNSVAQVDQYTVTNTQDYFPAATTVIGSLRYAVDNAARDGKTVKFQIRTPPDPGATTSWTISLLAPIIQNWNNDNPANGLVIDGLTQPHSNGRPVVQVANYGIEFDNASFSTGPGIVVQGLSFINYATPALVFNNIQGAKVVGNYIGLGVDQKPQTLSAGAGVLILGGSSSIDVGQPGTVNFATACPGANYIGGNTWGVYITGAATFGNHVVGNFIGTDGEAAFRNTTGVFIDDSTGNVVGGAALAAGTEPSPQNFGDSNIIGHNNVGIDVAGAGSMSNRILGNFIGVNPFNPTKFTPGNVDYGVVIEKGAGGNSVGSSGSNGVYANVIGNNGHVENAGTVDNLQGAGVLITNSNASNLVAGNYIGVDSAFNALGNTHGVVVSAAQGNLISNNTMGFNKGYGVFLTQADQNLIQGNFVGTNQSGAAIGNQKSGIYLSESNNNVIGTTTDWNSDDGDQSTLNIVSSNATNGIEIVASANNYVAGNLIGAGEFIYEAGSIVKAGALIAPDPAHPHSVATTSGNLQVGVVVTSGAGNLIGGPLVGGKLAKGVGNTIAGNGVDGVYVSGVATSPNVVQGNQIVRNLQNGVHVYGDLSGASTLAMITTNLIGTNEDGTTVYGPDNRSYGNGLSGVLLDEFSKVSPTPAPPPSTFGVYVTGNTLSGNGLSGLTARQAWQSQSALLRASVTVNMIGVDRTGKASSSGGLPFGNVLDGVRIYNVVGLDVESNVISANLGRGVEIDGDILTSPHSPALPTGWNNLVANNKIGTDVTGAFGAGQGGAGFGNLADGVFLLSPAATTIANNLIGGNRGAGIHATGSSVGTYALVNVKNNKIGTDGQGLDLNNGSDGVFLDTIQNVTIEGNTISKNRANGVDVLNSSKITIIGNVLGLAASPPPGAAGNYGNGVFLNGSHDVTIGGSDSGQGNVISGNQSSGVFISQGYGNKVLGNKIGVDADGTAAVPNQNSGVIISLSSWNVVGGTASTPGQGVGNTISGNQLYGVLIVGNPDLKQEPTEGNLIQGNLIGAPAPSVGALGLGNSSDGVFVLNAPWNTIGGLAQSQGNVISGNKGQGVRIFGASSTNNVVSRNWIGVDAAGATAVGNGGNGVLLDNAGANYIGVGNVISGNKQSGVMIVNTIQGEAAGARSAAGGGQTPAPAGSIIDSNLIGLAQRGLTAIPNNADGVLIFGSSYNSLTNNAISGNALDGVQIFSPAAGAPADSNTLIGNRIGTNQNGTQAVGNQGDGVHIINGSNNIIGDGTSGFFNVVSGNRYNGVNIDQQPGLAATGNRIDGNLIGTDASGVLSLGNNQFGVLVNNAVGNYIGVARGDGYSFASTSVPRTPSNVISGNLAAGVQLTGFAAKNAIRGNFIGVARDGTAYNSQGYGWGLSNPIGVAVNANAAGNTVGGATPGSGNIITQSGRNFNDQSAPPTTTYIGVEVSSPTATGNRIQGNMIGVDSQGQVGFNTTGVLLEDGVWTLVGDDAAAGSANGPLPRGANLISGNSLAGIAISGKLAQYNQIYNNYIGTDVTGAGRPGLADPPLPAPPRNPTQASGVLILQETQNTVGAVGRGNLISGNGVGVNIASQSGGDVKTSTNWVQGNRIGVDPTGTKANPNFEFGVFITASANNSIQNNMIAANGLAGVEIFGGASQLASNAQGTAVDLGTVLTGNVIGFGQVESAANHPLITLPDGIKVNFGLQQHGVVIIGASNTSIGLPGNGNTISGNIQTGVYISRRDNNQVLYALPINNVVQSNNLSRNGIYGVFRYDAPAGNPVLESPSANANTFTGTPIPIGDYVTGFNKNPPGSLQPRSALLGAQSPTTSTSTPTIRPTATIRRFPPAVSARRPR